LRKAQEPAGQRLNLTEGYRLTEILFVVGHPATLFANVLGVSDEWLDLLDIKVARTARKSAQLVFTTAFRGCFATHFVASHIRKKT
jgi:hypothetical protein